MRDPFGADVRFANVNRQSSSELVQPAVLSSGMDYMHGNGDSGPQMPIADSLVRHQVLRSSLLNDLGVEDLNSHIYDPEIKELYSKSRSQEEEILILRKQIAAASVKELQFLNDKHIVERKLSDTRMALDEKQDGAISDALKELTQKKGHIEENLRLNNDLKVAEEEVYAFTSSLLNLLSEYSIRPPLLNASTITSGTRRLYQHMQWKIRSLSASIGDMDHLLGNQAGHTSNTNHQIAASSRNRLSHSNMAGNMNNFHQHTQYQADPHAETTNHRPRFIQDYDMTEMREPVGNADNTGDALDRRSDADSQFYMPMHDNHEMSGDAEAPLPGIEGFQIIGEARPGYQLKACGYPTNGTTLCIFQWVRYLENGTRQSIEGATVPEYVVTADDVDALLAVDCTPMDDHGHQGELARQFANNKTKITCDPEMQRDLDAYISAGRAEFTVLSLIDSSDDWEWTMLTLKRSSYQIKLERTETVIIEEKYSPDLSIKVPNGGSTQFVLVSSGGIAIPVNTDGTSQPNSPESDIWLRDLIVLAMRIFQNKALDGKRKGKA